MSNVPNSMMRVMALLRIFLKIRAGTLHVFRYRGSKHFIVVEPHAIAKLLENFYYRFFFIQILWRKVEHMRFKNSSLGVGEYYREIVFSSDANLGRIHPGYARGSERDVDSRKPELCGAFCS